MTKQFKKKHPKLKQPRVKKEQSQQTYQKQQKRPLKSTRTKIEKEKKKVQKKGKGKRNRLIIRNLVFDVNQKHLRKLLTPYGQIVDLQVPTNPNNQKCNKGFAFVEFSQYRTCEKVIKQLNQQKYKGRPIIIDFSIAKPRFMAGKIKEQQPKQQGNNQEHNNEEDNQSQIEQPVQKKQKREEKAIKEEQKVKEQPSFNHDNEDNSRTIFVRNLPNSIDEQTLKTFFYKYGKVKWAKIVIDKETKASKGTAFVKFVDSQLANRLIEYSRSYELSLIGKNSSFKADPKINLQLEGTILKLFPVQKRQIIAEKMKERNEKDDKKAKKLKPLKKIKRIDDLIAYDKQGKRKIALAALGVWSAKEDMSETDKQRFKNHSRQKIQKLKNPNYSVSDKRIVLKYLSKQISEEQIRDTASDFLSANKLSMKQLTYCKLMLDNERKKSAGYAFLQFKDPSTSKMFVEQLAQNQQVLMPSPFVVEFALQDSRKLQKMQKKKGT